MDNDTRGQYLTKISLVISHVKNMELEHFHI